MRWIFPRFLGGGSAVALLLVRLVMGAAMILHGWPKMQNPTGWMQAFGMPPAPAALQVMAALAEVGGGALLILGLLTPLAALAIIGQMIGALVIVHLPNGDPFVNASGASYELALVYLVLALQFLLIGPGKLSIDYLLFGRQGHRPAG